MASDAIELVGLRGFENHYPKSLSGGMKMRASLARTLTLKPPVFLFDEPFGAVDEITREHLNDETQLLFQREGFAGLFITHSISEAVFMSTRVLVMSARPGRIVAEFDIPFEYPRNPDLRFDPDFARTQRRDLPRPARCPLMTATERRPIVERGRHQPTVPAPDMPIVADAHAEPHRDRWSAQLLPPIVLGALLIGFWYFVVLRDARRISADSCCSPPHEVVRVGFLDWDNFSEILDRSLVEHQGRHASGC